MRLIDADALLEAVALEEIPERFDPDSYVIGVASVLRKIHDAPTIEAGPVVRCRDCRHYIPGVDKGPNKYTYPKCRVTDTVTSDHHYCAFGNAKTGGEQLTLLSEED